MNPHDEARLKGQFQQIREDDSQTVPDFAATLSAAGRRAEQRSAPRRLILAAGLLSLAAAIVAYRAGQPAPAPPAKPLPLLSWTSPTGFLLDPPAAVTRAHTRKETQ